MSGRGVGFRTEIIAVLRPGGHMCCGVPPGCHADTNCAGRDDEPVITGAVSLGAVIYHLQDSVFNAAAQE